MIEVESTSIRADSPSPSRSVLSLGKLIPRSWDWCGEIAIPVGGLLSDSGEGLQFLHRSLGYTVYAIGSLVLTLEMSPVS